jgi:hypothetical protein
MQVQVSMGTTVLTMLLDSGLTHNFIDVATAEGTDIVFQGGAGLRVVVTNDNQPSSPGYCSDLAIDIGGEALSITCYGLALGSFDMVLGVQWLKSLGPAPLGLPTSHDGVRPQRPVHHLNCLRVIDHAPRPGRHLGRHHGGALAIVCRHLPRAGRPPSYSPTQPLDQATTGDRGDGCSSLPPHLRSKRRSRAPVRGHATAQRHWPE